MRFRAQRRPSLADVISLLAVLLVAPCAYAKDKPITSKDEIAFGIRMAERELWSEALFRFQQAEVMGDKSAAVYNNVAVAYEALGVFDKAREYYQKALAVDRDSQNLRRNYSRFVEFYQAFNPDGEDEDEGGEEEAGEGGKADEDAAPEVPETTSSADSPGSARGD